MAAEAATLLSRTDPRGRPLVVVDVLVASSPQPEGMIGGVIVVALLVIALLAPLIAPKDPNDGELGDSLAAPGRRLCPRR